MHLLVLFNLKSEADKEAYEHWAKTTDIPTVKKLKSIDSFHLFSISAILGSKDISPYQYAELIEVNNMDEFSKEIQSEIMQKVAKEFQSFAEQPLFMVTNQLA